MPVCRKCASKERDGFRFELLRCFCLNQEKVAALCAFPPPDRTYSGLVAHDKMFKTANGKSFKCKSENQLLMSSLLQVKLVPLQIQAFSLDKGQYGKGGRTPHWRCAGMHK